MPRSKVDALGVGLSDAEKHALEKIIAECGQHRHVESPVEPKTPTQDQLEAVTQKLADLSHMVLAIDRQITTLIAVIRLSHQKSERLNQRLDAVIAALKNGVSFNE
jgi:hypothetical protein